METVFTFPAVMLDVLDVREAESTQWQPALHTATCSTLSSACSQRSLQSRLLSIHVRR